MSCAQCQGLTPNLLLVGIARKIIIEFFPKVFSFSIISTFYVIITELLSILYTLLVDISP